jgi:hypothetical protein
MLELFLVLIKYKVLAFISGNFMSNFYFSGVFFQFRGEIFQTLCLAVAAYDYS